MSNPLSELKSIFGHAIELESPEERAEYLAKACGDNAVLRSEIDGLIRAMDQAGAFMQAPAAAGGGAASNKTVEHSPSTESTGTVIGPYKLLEQIGEGGMGVVYMADQQSPIQRRVALKIIKPGMDTRQVIARFEAERQALALMDHPNIAKVLDAGATESGRPYFVMELVRGIPITEYCDQNNLSISERLELAVSVCHAVQHAHQKGIIHRDLKPSNVMVTLHDGRPVPKVIDFGVAKAINQRLTDKTLFTNFAQMVGTPLYMSPEQAEMSGLDVDTRSDIYSLGVLLYELLTSTTPFDLQRMREAALDEIRRMIREDEPQRPSTRISTLGESRTAAAAHRRVDPSRLCEMLKGELDWVVMKALEKDRTLRYETANGLARDIQRYLADQPVEACPPSAAYRFRKFARRNRTALATVALLLLALTLGIVGSTWQAVRATRAERLAETRLIAETEARAEADTAHQAEAQQRRLAESERAEAEQQRATAEANFQMARQAVDKYFTAISENELLDEAGMEPLRKDLLEAALEYYQGFAEQQVDDPAVLGELAATHSRIAQIYAATGSTEWPTAYSRCLDIVERLYREAVDPALWAGSLAGSFSYSSKTGDPRVDNPLEALRVFQRGIDVYGKLAEEHPGVVAFQEELATNCLVVALMQNGPLTEQAIPNFQRAQRIWEELARNNPAQTLYANHLLIVYEDLAWGLGAAGRGHEIAGFRRDAIATLRETYGSENGELASMLRSLAEHLMDEGRLEEAEEHLREALRICDSLLEKRKTPRSLRAVRDTHMHLCLKLGELLNRTGRSEDAEQQFRRAMSGAKELASQAASSSAQGALIETLVAQGKLTEALDEARSAARIYPKALHVHQRLRRVLDEIGDAEKTLAIMRENAELLPDSEMAHTQYGKVLEERGRLDEAVREFARGLEADPSGSWPHYNIARVRLRQNRLPEALDAARSAVRIDPNSRFITLLFEVLDKIGDAEKALAVMRELKIGSDTPWPHYHIARVRLRQNRLPEALDAAQTAVRISPKEYRLQIRLFEVLNKIGDAEKTLSVMRENAQLYPDSEPAHHWYALALKDQGQLDEAVREFERGLEINPDTPWSHYHIAGIRLRQDKLSEALDAARSAVRIDPKEPQFRFRLLEALIKNGDGGDEEARKELASFSEELLRDVTKINDPNRLNYLAWTLGSPRDVESKIAGLAVEAALRACELRPGNPMLLNTLGVAQYRKGDYAAAVGSLERSRYCDNNSIPLLPAIDCYFLAMSNAQLGHGEVAEKWFRAADLWMALFAATNDELKDFQQEAIDVLGIEAEPLVAASTTPEAEQRLLQLCLAADPDAGWAHHWLGMRLAERGAWAEASEQLALAARFEEDAKAHGATDESISQLVFDRALLSVQTRDFDTYRQLCRTAVERMGQTGDAQDPARIGIQCKLAPGALDDFSSVLKLLEKAINKEPNNWLFRGVRAHLLYRSGDAEAAAEQLEQVVTTNKATSLSQPYDKFFLAMAHHDLGHEAEAQRYFREAASWIDRDGRLDLQEGAVVSEPLAWRLRLDLMLLRAEAQQHLDSQATETADANGTQ